MDRDEITRSDFPMAPDGYERRSVDAHLLAVAAFVDALRVRVDALGVEIEALRGGGLDPGQPAPGGDRPEPTEATTGPVDPPPDGNTEGQELSDDPVSARLAASKLHLDGLGRDEIVGRIVAGYRLDDPEGLVDEVIEGLS
jgi:hypothetical protein